MKTLFFFCLTLCAAFVVDIIIGPLGGSLIPSLAVIAACFWLWRLDRGERLAAGCAAGILLDVIGFFPLGTYTSIMLMLVFLCEPMKSFFSNTESRLVTLINVTLLVMLFRILAPPVAALVAHV